MSRLELPLSKKPIRIGVEQKDKRITEGCVYTAHTDKIVHCVVHLFKGDSITA